MSGKPFVLGKEKTGGRAKGTRNRLSQEFLSALLAEFEAHGAEAIRICRTERPIDFVKIVASLMPREIEFQDNTLAEVSDTDLEAFIEIARRRIAERAIEIRSREEPTSIN
jgi:hypothetical protein